MISHAPALMDPMAAQRASLAVTQSPQWLQVIQAVGAIATTIGVLIALYVAVIRDPRNASKEHSHHTERMDALQRLTRERAAAQARKVVASCGRIPMFGDSWWTVRIDNASNAMTTILAVDVIALDANGFEKPGGFRQAHSTLPFDQAFDRAIRAAESESLDGCELPVAPRRPGNDLVPAFKQAIRDALAGHLVKGWPRTLPTNQYAVMAYTTTDPTYELRVTIDYEDEAGYQWRRTDTSQPRRTDQEPLIGKRW
jgi:hypothetical protein